MCNGLDILIMTKYGNLSRFHKFYEFNYYYSPIHQIDSLQICSLIIKERKSKVRLGISLVLASYASTIIITVRFRKKNENRSS